MKITIFPLLWAISAVVVCSASEIDGICKAIKNVAGCKVIIQIPTVKTTTCYQKGTRLDPCKTKKSFRYVCGFNVSWKGASNKMCDGWTCVPGSHETQWPYPCVKFGSQSLNLCELARKSVPGADSLIQSTSKICSCIPKALDLITSSLGKDIIKSHDVSAATVDILQAYGSVVQCVTDNGFKVQNTSLDLTVPGGALAQTNTIKIFTASEMNLARYTSFATIIAGCLVGACEPDLLRSWFTDYITDSEAAIGAQLKNFFNPWQNALVGISASFDRINYSIKQFQEQIGIIESSIEKIVNDFCTNIASCAKTSVKRLQIKVAETIKSSSTIIGLRSKILDARVDIQDMQTTVTDAIKAFENLSDLSLTGIIEQVTSGKIRSIDDIARNFRAVEQLPKTFEKLLKTLPKVEKYVKELQVAVPTFVASIDSIVAASWIRDAEAETALAGKSVAAVKRIQILFQDNIIMFSTSIHESFASLTANFESIFFSGRPSLKVGVASYRRWTRVSFDMACLSTGKKTFDLGATKKTVDYPKFERCHKEFEIPFPNHHIPYIRVEFNAGLVAASQLPVSAAAAGPTESLPVETSAVIVTPWPFITEISGDKSPIVANVDNFNLDALTITAEAMPTAEPTPADFFTNSEDALSMMTYNSDVVLYTTTDENGETVKSFTLPPTATVEMMATETQYYYTAVSAANFGPLNQDGFEEGELIVTPNVMKRSTVTSAVSYNDGTVLQSRLWLLVGVFIVVGLLA